MVEISILIDDKQMEFLKRLTKYREVKKDILDEDFLQSIFKIGLMDVVAVYGKSSGDSRLLDAANNYMVSEMDGQTFTLDELADFWKGESGSESLP